MALPKIREQIEARVKDTGDTMTDNLIIKRDTYPGVALDVLGTGTRTSLQGWDNSAVLVNFNISGNTDNRRAIFIKNSSTATQIKNALTLRDWVNGTSAEYKIYGEHNKPTPADIGAATASHVHNQYYTSDMDRTANTVLAAPNGSAGSASFRKLVSADIPDLSGSYLKLSGGTMTGPIDMNVGTGLSMAYESGKDTPWIYPKGATEYGIRYLEGTPDKMMISASGNNTTAGGADLCINGNGEGTVTIRGNTILHAGNYNSYAPTKTGGGASGTWPISISGSAGSVSWGNVSGKPDFSRAPIVYTINLSSYSTSNFYFVDFGTSTLELDCEIHSRGASAGDSWNQNVLHFLMVGQGWSDTPKNLTILNQSFYDGNEKTIMSIVHGNQAGVRGVYLRGGLTYTIKSNFAPNLNTTTKTQGNESYASGTTSYTTITNATTLWTNDGVNKSIFSMPVNAVMLSSTDYTTYRGRSIAANTSALTSGSSSLSDGYIYLQYE